MSGNVPGPQAQLVIKKKNPAQYPPDPAHPGHNKIHKESDVQATVATPATTAVKLGLRIKSAQKVDKFVIHSPQGDVPLTIPPANEAQAIAQELATVLGNANGDDQWVIFYAEYDKKYGKKFDTELELAPFDVHDNGFQVVTVVFTHKNRSFATDNYVFGLSVLPGENSAALQLALGAGGERSGRSAKKKSVARPAKARKKGTAKKSRQKRSR